MCEIRVGGGSRVSKVAGSIAKCVRKTCYAEVVAIGVPAIVNALRSVIVARGYLAGTSELVFVPEFSIVMASKGKRRAVTMFVYCVENVADIKPARPVEDWDED